MNSRKKPYIPSVPITDYEPYPNIHCLGHLTMMGNIMTMTENWSFQEMQQGRRLVQFSRESTDQKSIRYRFHPVTLDDYYTNTTMMVTSCIYWEEKKEYFITSVDCIHLLEYLMQIQFSVEERNRVRRNLEGFRPYTVRKSGLETARFFQKIMEFSKPKPRHIEKDLKVFPWKALPYALKKIVTKYMAPQFLETIHSPTI